MDQEPKSFYSKKKERPEGMSKVEYSFRELGRQMDNAARAAVVAMMVTAPVGAYNEWEYQTQAVEARELLTRDYRKTNRIPVYKEKKDFGQTTPMFEFRLQVDGKEKVFELRPFSYYTWLDNEQAELVKKRTEAEKELAKITSQRQALEKELLNKQKGVKSLNRNQPQRIAENELNPLPQPSVQKNTREQKKVPVHKPARPGNAWDEWGNQAFK